MQKRWADILPCPEGLWAEPRHLLPWPSPFSGDQQPHLHGSSSLRGHHHHGQDAGLRLICPDQVIQGGPDTFPETGEQSVLWPAHADLPLASGASPEWDGHMEIAEKHTGAQEGMRV